MQIVNLKDAIHVLVDRMKSDRFYEGVMERFEDQQEGFMYEATLRVLRNKDGTFKASLAMNEKIQAGNLGFLQGLEA
jgi:hypothetical protein